MTARSRRGLATRIAVLAVAVAALTAVIAALLTLGVVRRSNETAARSRLAKIADAAQRSVDGSDRSGAAGLRGALQSVDVKVGFVRGGALVTDSSLVRESVDPSMLSELAAGKSVSARTSGSGTTVYVEGRPVTGGAAQAIVVVQRRTDALQDDERALRASLIAVLVSAGIAALLGLLVAWRLARPLRRTAEAAHALAVGHRDVLLPADGPREVVEVSEAVNTLASALRYSEARQQEFLTSVSHDLRTPLTGIKAYAETLADGVLPPEEMARAGAVLLGESARLERLVGDLLDLARLGAREFRIDPGAVDLVTVARDAEPAWRARCDAVGVELRMELPDSQWCWTDAGRVRQLLDGLFDNALRVTPAGAPIVLAVRPEPGWAVAEVRDGGPGLQDADLAVAFDQGALYDRYRGVRQVGTGLGLAIVHGLVGRLGGTVEAGHAHEGGARFTVRLPVDQHWAT